MMLVASVSASAKEMALQLYSVRDLIGTPELYRANADSVFRELHQMGYTAIEMWGYSSKTRLFLGQSAEKVRADVERAGMKIVSSHVVRPLTEEEYAKHDYSKALEWWKRTIEDNRKLGIKYIVTSLGGEAKTLKDVQTCAEYYNAIGRLCREAGLTYCYHSHWWEYKEMEGTTFLDYLIQHTDPQLVSFQMDVYWAVYGRVCPVEYFWKYPGRFKLLHIKDKYEIGGSGFVGFDAIFRNADVAGVEAFMVELENAPKDKSAMQCLRESAEYLQKADFVRDSYSGPKLSVFADHINTIAKQESLSFAQAAEKVKAIGVRGADVYVYQKASQLRTLDSLGFAHSSAIAYIDYFGQAKGVPAAVLGGGYFSLTWQQQEERAIAFCKRYGYPRLMLVPGTYKGKVSEENIEQVRNRMVAFAKRAAEEGIDVTVESYDDANSLCYGSERLTKLLDAAPTLGLAFDIGNFVFAKEDPMKALGKLGSKVRLVHLKDRASKKDMTSVPAGTGCAKVAQIVSQLRANGYQGWHVIEVYGSKHMLEDVTTAYNNMVSLLK